MDSQLKNQSVILKINSSEKKDNLSDKKAYLFIISLIAIIYFGITYLFIMNSLIKYISNSTLLLFYIN